MQRSLRDGTVGDTGGVWAAKAGTQAVPSQLRFRADRARQCDSGVTAELFRTEQCWIPTPSQKEEAVPGRKKR